jgi:hypothetical protein
METVGERALMTLTLGGLVVVWCDPADFRALFDWFCPKIYKYTTIFMFIYDVSLYIIIVFFISVL